MRRRASAAASSLPLLRLDDHQRDITRRLLLVLSVAPVRSRDARPERRLFFRRGDPCPHPSGATVHHHLYLRVVAEVEEPGGVAVIAAVGRNEYDALSVLDRRREHRRPWPAALASGGGKHHDRHAAEAVEQQTVARAE